MKKSIALTVVAFTLSGCLGNGGGGGGDTQGPTTSELGVLPSGFDASLDVATDEIVLTVDGVEVARVPNTNTSASGEFGFYQIGQERALYGQTNSGDGSVFIVSSPTVNLGLAGVQVNRLGETNLPSSGSATFNGQYEGLMVDSGLNYIGRPNGDAQLTADFANSSISGTITNRIFGSAAAEDIVLTSATITSAGAFSGTTTGGDINGLFPSTASDGSYAGLIVGAAGNEVVGGLSITQIFGAGTFTEIGAFVAAE